MSWEKQDDTKRKESEESTMNRMQGSSWDMTQHPPMPRPTDDDGYFEEMSKVVFRAGLRLECD